MLINLGISPSFAELPFEPEAGAYGEHGSDHAHGHTHGVLGNMQLTRKQALWLCAVDATGESEFADWWIHLLSRS